MEKSRQGLEYEVGRLYDELRIEKIKYIQEIKYLKLVILVSLGIIILFIMVKTIWSDRGWFTPEVLISSVIFFSFQLYLFYRIMSDYYNEIKRINKEYFDRLIDFKD
jgi:hypothetical protein